MPTTQITNGHRPLTEITTPAVATGDEQHLRQLALKQIELKRNFHIHAFAYLAGSIALTLIWAISEYHNAGGWPSHGFSQSSSIPHVWNIWIIYPVLGWGLAVAIHGWSTYKRKPITEHEITREIQRLTGSPRE
jgi:H+/Cl- antiporter ClcA